MTSRQHNMIMAAVEGIELARARLSEPASAAAMMDAMRNDMPWNDDDKGMTVARAAYLACVYLAWKDAGCPDP